MPRSDHVMMQTATGLHVALLTITVERETMVQPTEIIVEQLPIQIITISEHDRADSRIQQIIITLLLPVEPDREPLLTPILHAVRNQQRHRKEMVTMNRVTAELVLASPYTNLLNRCKIGAMRQATVERVLVSLLTKLLSQYKIEAMRAPVLDPRLPQWIDQVRHIAVTLQRQDQDHLKALAVQAAVLKEHVHDNRLNLG